MPYICVIFGNNTFIFSIYTEIQERTYFCPCINRHINVELLRQLEQREAEQAAWEKERIMREKQRMHRSLSTIDHRLHHHQFPGDSVQIEDRSRDGATVHRQKC